MSEQSPQGRDGAPPDGFRMEPLLNAVERDQAGAQRGRAAAAGARHLRRVDLVRGILLAAAGISLGTAIALGGSGPTAAPDPGPDPFGGALSTIAFEDEFNRLPVEERIALVRELLEKMRSMDSGSSAMLAAFAAGIREHAREQLQTNARRLMVDYMDHHAKRYAEAHAEDREEMLEESLREMVKLQRELIGLDADDEGVDEGIARAQRDAEREQQRAAENRTRLDSQEAAGFMRWAQREGEDASPNQRARVTLFMRDMTRHMRGQNLDTGEPKSR